MGHFRNWILILERDLRRMETCVLGVDSEVVVYDNVVFLVCLQLLVFLLFRVGFCRGRRVMSMSACTCS
ncbi:hypothetical protein L6452_07797 [Arctium lappa]|uniref:Uncharacterized protein n=1 Tax=Arctium lappa TaxID=4217 RepID=A0ACB9ELM5_ARCLA|nr:hypothetical protein L6452_07797 [Arctium lappa]